MSEATVKDKTAIIGLGETKYYKRGQAPIPEFRLACEAIIKAAGDAGIDVRDIDGISGYADDRNDASRLATAASGQGITVRMRKAELAWAGYRQGGGVPLFLQLGDISIRNAVGVELVDIPAARLVFKPSALLGGKAPVFISGQQARFAGSTVPVSLAAALHLNDGFRLSSADIAVSLGAGEIGAGQRQPSPDVLRRSHHFDLC